MALSPETKLGRYKIERALGVGGMGEIYLARDTTLNRKVAIKLLPAEFSQNEGRLRRFEQEALAVASLNHPNIAHIYEIAEADGYRFIAMEFIDGVTLTDKIHHERAPLKKLLKYLAHSADALAKAHAAGIIHRDLKPDNIMVTIDDHAKVLDFGLAKLVESESDARVRKTASEESATAILEQPLSTPGVIMGTVGYMSPEQAQGRSRDIDHRSDIFSFGCILFEAVTGKRAFKGSDQLDTLHKIVHAPTPQISEHNPQAPTDLQRILRRCLAKDPEERFQSIKDVAIELREVRRELDDSGIHMSATDGGGVRAATGGGVAGTATSTGPLSTSEVSGPTHNPSSAELVLGGIRRHRTVAALIILVVIGAGLAAVYGAYKFFGFGGRGDRPSVMKVTRLTTSGKVRRAAISGDGRYAAHVVEDPAGQSLWVRQIATSSDINIVPASATQYRGAAFSSDGNYVYYVKREGAGTKSSVFQVPTLGGASRKILDGADSTVTLSPDGKQLAFLRVDFAKGSSSVVAANVDGSGERVITTRVDPQGFEEGMAWSPDGKLIACSGFDGINSDAVRLVAVSVADGATKEISPKRYGSIISIAWIADGSGMLISAADKVSGYFYQIWHVSVAGGKPRRVTNDLISYGDVSLTADSKSALTVQGDWLSNLWVAPNGEAGKAVRISSGKYDGGAGVAWAPDGRIVSSSRNWEISILNADGTGQRVLTGDERNNRWASVSPDGRYILFESWRASPTDSTLWRMDIDGGNPIPLTGKGWASVPRASPDSKWVVYESNLSGVLSLWKTSIDGAGEPTQLSDINAGADEPAISPDGKLIACFYYPEGKPVKIAVIPFEGGAPVHVFDVDKSVRDKTPAWTPDGKAVIYILHTAGVSNLFAQPLAGGPPKQITDFKEGRIFAFDWSRDGKQLLLSRGDIANDVVLISDFR